MFDTLAYHSSVFYRDFTTYTSEKLEKLGLHFGLLFFLIYVGKHPGTTPSDLTEALHLDWGHSQRCITKLVENGFLTKEKAGRRYQLDLTERGREAFAISHQVFFDWDEKRLAVLTEEERQTLFALLRKLTPSREVPRHV
ncbi:bilirubin utilization transcriptional regulator BilQ [Candidatus Allofournierella excrementavium]|uniref:bilirubin utilization transcriptional regulator BilQ n=1 Tax=Candidatus Allofournierella excrementavium TaxID=2838591 RepID=UPI00374FA957